MKLLKGKRLESVASVQAQLDFCRVYFCADGPASVSGGEEGEQEGGTLGCVIACSRTRRLGLRTALQDAGVMALSDPS